MTEAEMEARENLQDKKHEGTPANTRRYKKDKYGRNITIILKEINTLKMMGSVKGISIWGKLNLESK